MFISVLGKLFKILLLVLLVGVLFLQTDYAKSRILALVCQELGCKVEVSRIETSLPLKIRFSNVVLDKITIDQLDASISLPDLLRGTLKISHISIPHLKLTDKIVVSVEGMFENNHGDFLVDETAHLVFNIQENKIPFQLEVGDYASIDGEVKLGKVIEVMFTLAGIEGNIHFDGKTAAINAQGNDLTLDDWSCKTITLQGEMSDLWQTGELGLQCQGVSSAGVEVGDISILTHLEENNWWYTATLRGPIEAKATGSWSLRNCQVASLTGTVQNLPMTLNKPFEIAVNGESLQVSPVELSIGKGTLHLIFAKDQVKRQLTLRGIALPLPRGEFDLSASFLSEGEKPALGFVKGAFREASATGEVEADFQENALHIQAIATGLTPHPIHIKAELPVTLSLWPIKVNIDKEDAIAARLDVEGELAPLLKLLGTDTLNLAGFFKAEIEISGTLTDPEVKGRAELKEGFFESLTTGAVFRNLTATLEGAGNQLFIRTLEAQDGKGGKLSGTGELLFDPKQQFPFVFTMQMQKAALLQLDYVRASATGSLEVRGNKLETKLTGALTLDGAIIRIPEEAPPQLTAVDVTYINKPKELDVLTPPPPAVQRTLLDVTLTVPGSAFVTGRDISSEWQGDIQFQGTIEKPLLSGGLKAIHGEYSFNGKGFSIQQGLISFNGEPKKTTLSVVATCPLDPIRIDATFKGPIGDPVLSFRSNPPLSQKEILSYLLFNRGTLEITPQQGAELQQTIVTVSGGQGDNDFLGRLRRSFGIDRVDISSVDSDDQNEVSLRVGKYLSRGIFVSVNKSINSNVNQIAIEATLIKNLKATAEIGDDSAAKMLLLWERDY